MSYPGTSEQLYPTTFVDTDSGVGATATNGNLWDDDAADFSIADAQGSGRWAQNVRTWAGHPKATDFAYARKFIFAYVTFLGVLNNPPIDDQNRLRVSFSETLAGGGGRSDVTLIEEINFVSAIHVPFFAKAELLPGIVANNVEAKIRVDNLVATTYAQGIIYGYQLWIEIVPNASAFGFQSV